MKYVIALVVLLGLAGALEWHGHHRGYDDGVAATNDAADKKIKAAQKDAAQARSERDATALTLSGLQEKLHSQKEQLESSNAIAKAAIADRNRVQGLYNELAAKRKKENEDAAHANVACTGLVHLPVCPAVGVRLWGNAAGTAQPSH